MSDAGPTSTPASRSVWPTVLAVTGATYVGLGLLLGAATVMGEVQSSLLPTGWLFPAVLLASGGLMATRRRFDIVITLWAGLTLAVFMIGVLLYVNALDRGLDDAAAFDASIIVAGFGLLPLVLRPWFRS
jgi:hypothetical protein